MTDRDVVEAAVKAHDYDRWLAVLHAPADRRDDLLALAAFNVEIARVRDVVRDPRPGEIRFQWWRDALSGIDAHGAGAHPVARAVLGVMARRRLPLGPFLNLIEARTFDLYDDPMPTVNDLEGYAGETASAMLRLGSLALSDGDDDGSAEAAGHAGVAIAIAGLLQALPVHARRGQCYLPLDLLARHGASREEVVSGSAAPGLLAALAAMRAHARDHLGRARALGRAVPPRSVPAFLPLLLVEPTLAALERRAGDPFGAAVELPRWRRIWAMRMGAGRLFR